MQNFYMLQRAVNVITPGLNTFILPITYGGGGAAAADDGAGAGSWQA